MEILSYNIYKKNCEIDFEVNGDTYKFEFKYELDKSYSDNFNPGSLYGHYQTFSGYYPEDIELENVYKKVNDDYVLISEDSFISDVTLEEYIKISNQLESFIMENYDCD